MGGGYGNIKPEDNPKPFQKGNKLSTGRPKKFYTQMKDLGFKSSEVTECIQTMMGCDVEILNKVYQDQTATALERLVAKVIGEALKSGDLSNIDRLFSRAWGQSKQEVTIKKVGKDVEGAEEVYV